MYLILSICDRTQYYLLDIIENSTDSEMEQNLLLILLGVIKLGCVFVAGKFFDRKGRRPMVFLSLIGTSFVIQYFVSNMPKSHDEI